MLGLLGGLLGRAVARPMARPAFRTPLGGLLANRMASRVINPRQARPTSVGGAPEQAEKPQPEQTQQPQQQSQQPQQQEAAPAQQPAQPQPLPVQASESIGQVEQKRTEVAQNPGATVEQRPVTEGLLDPAPPAAPKQQDAETPAPVQIANQTDAATPVAQQADEQFPATPQLALSGLVDRIGDTPERRSFPLEDVNPSKPVDVRSQAKHTQNSPGYNYQSLGSWTALTPSYSYRR